MHCLYPPPPYNTLCNTHCNTLCSSQLTHPDACVSLPPSLQHALPDILRHTTQKTLIPVLSPPSPLSQRAHSPNVSKWKIVHMTRTLTQKYTHINMHTHTNIDTHIDTQILVHIQEQTYRLSCFCARTWKQRRFSKYHVAAAQSVCVLSHMHVMIWFFHSFLSL